MGICRCLSCITPPHLLKKLLESKDKQIRQAALSTLLTTERLRGEREVRSALIGAAPTAANGRRSIYDCHSSTNLASAQLVRTEDGSVSTDTSVNQAFAGLGATRDFYRMIFNRKSVDDRGMRLDGYVHRGTRYNNAFWDGQEMVFGDGDGIVFGDFTGSLDVIAHELTHGVTEFSAGLEYHYQSGALNESMSDVFGSLVKQWVNEQKSDEADWLIGSEIFTPGRGADALRSLKAPGTAYDDPELGKDPQPDHMSKYMELPDTDDGDWGGVHINSGIPNRAFYLSAIGVGGHAWEAPGHVWYEALLASNVTTQFQEFADTTYIKAGQLYGTGSVTQKAVLAAWREVGIQISGLVSLGSDSGRLFEWSGDGGGGDGLAALDAKLDALSKDVKSLAKEMTKLKTHA